MDLLMLDEMLHSHVRDYVIPFRVDPWMFKKEMP